MYKVSHNNRNIFEIPLCLDDLIDSDFDERMKLKLGNRNEKISLVIETVNNPDINHIKHWENIYGFTENEMERDIKFKNYKKELLNEIREFLLEELPELDYEKTIKNTLNSMNSLRLYSVSIQIKELFLVDSNGNNIYKKYKTN